MQTETRNTLPIADDESGSATPLVTIGLPVYNGARFLRETLDSLLAQTWRDFEIVISDNASTDGTPEICQRYAEQDKRIRYHREPQNRGAAFNYNRVVELARGRYFKWSAADDLCSPNTLQSCVECLDAHPDVVLSYPKTTIIDADSNVVEEYDDGLDVRLDRPVDRLRAVMRLTRECNAVFGLCRTRCIRRTALIGRYMGSDGVLLGELSLHGQFAEIRSSTFFRRVHPEASSSDKSLKSQTAFYDPRVSKRFFLRTWRHSWEHARAVWRAPISWSEKRRCWSVVLRSAVASRQHLIAELGTALRHLVGRPAAR